MATDGMARLSVGVSVMVALSLAVFLTIVILLLADLFCSHLRRRRLRADATDPPHKWPKHRGHGGSGSLSPPHAAGTGADDASVATLATTATATTAREALTSTPPFYYAHGVMCAPSRKDLLLAIPRLEAAVWRWSPARRSSPSPSPSPPRSDEPTARGSSSSSAHSDGLMYISNPVYERGAAAGHGHDTPFETPDASPSRCGITEDGAFSPPLSMMRKLPPLGVPACPPPAVFDGRPPVTLWPGTVADANRASSSSSNFTARFFSS